MVDAQKIEDITHKYTRVSYNRIFISDSDYSIPTKKWVTRNYKKYYKKKMNEDKTLGLLWKEKHDCDNFSTAYRMYLQALHSIQPGKSGESIAVAEIWYMRDIGGGHAINLVIVDDYQPLFIEPQTGDEVKLSNKEKLSIWFVRF